MIVVYLVCYSDLLFGPCVLHVNITHITPNVKHGTIIMFPFVTVYYSMIIQFCVSS